MEQPRRTRTSAPEWLLSRDERGNPDTTLDTRHGNGLAWTRGNTVRPLVHGAVYFHELLNGVQRLGSGDLLLFTDWRGDPDEALDENEIDVGTAFAAAARRGAQVYGLLWRSHEFLKFGSRENRNLSREVEAAGGHCLLDMRVRPFGSHHQKLVVLRYSAHPDDDVAYVGGIDLSHGRRDDSDHHGDPQAPSMAAAYGEQPPWHDVQAAIRGPAVGDVELAFRERWDDSTPLTMSPVPLVSSWLHREPKRPAPLPPQGPDPGPRGTLAVQLLRTYPPRRPRYPFARHGERSIARAYSKALSKATGLVYVEDQYLWSREVASVYAAALRRQPELQMIFIVPAYAEDDGRLSGPPNLVGRRLALNELTAAGGDRFAAYSPENEDGTPVYVHAKVCIIDDRWACIGSDNTNRRSWTHDSELSTAVVDESPGGWVRSLRLSLTREHLGASVERTHDLDDPIVFFDAFRDSARRLDSWHRSGERGPRPPGRLRPFSQPPVPRQTRLWAAPMYRVVFDPDGRPSRLRRSGRY